MFNYIFCGICCFTFNGLKNKVNNTVFSWQIQHSWLYFEPNRDVCTLKKIKNSYKSNMLFTPNKIQLEFL